MRLFGRAAQSDKTPLIKDPKFKPINTDESIKKAMHPSNLFDFWLDRIFESIRVKRFAFICILILIAAIPSSIGGAAYAIHRANERVVQQLAASIEQSGMMDETIA